MAAPEAGSTDPCLPLDSNRAENGAVNGHIKQMNGTIKEVPFTEFPLHGFQCCEKRRAPLWAIVSLICNAVFLITIVILSTVFISEKRRETQLCPVHSCPDGWIGYRRRCYYFAEAEGDWEFSRKNCSAFDASLAVIDSQEELAVAGAPSLLRFFVLLLLLVVVVKKEPEGVVASDEGSRAPPPRSPSRAKETPGRLPRTLAPLGGKSDAAQPHPDSASSGPQDFLRRYKTSADYWIGLKRNEGTEPWRWINGAIFNNTFRIRGRGACAYVNHEGIASSSCVWQEPWICSKPPVS